MENKLDVIIEIPKHSNIKYEYDRKTKQIAVDRILYGANIYPQNYGFIPNTLDWDGDELDALVIADQSFIPGVSVPVRILGAMEMIDSGETDTKLITVISCDKRFDHIRTLEDVPQHIKDEIQNFFEQYKALQKKTVKVLGFKDLDWAVNEYKTCQELAQKYSDMPKKEFVEMMHKHHPEKYTKE